MAHFKILGTLIISLILLLQCSTPKKESYRLGDINLEVNGSEEAKGLFNKGLLLLHSFEYWDAAEAFIQAQEADPKMVMAYWGEAMTYNHPLWRAQDYNKGTAALSKLADTKEARASLALSELEGDLLESVEILYGEGEKFDRDKAYSEYLYQLYGKYTDNHEVAAFYAISLLGSVEEGRDEDIYEKSAVVAAGILEENPNHPGALHYMIHSYDDPQNAYKALAAANSYSTVAKDASHALHMPSHIYVALGMWDEVVSSNEASFSASAERAARKDQKSGGSYHALHWLMYGYLQQGRLAEGQKLLEDMSTYMTKFPSKGANDYMISMKGTFLVETNDWQHELANIEVDAKDLLVSSRSAYSFVEGMKAFDKGDMDGLQAVITQIDNDRTKAYGRIETRNVAMCSSNWQYEFPNQLDIDQSHVMQLELSALLAWHKKDTLKTLELMAEATALEERISYSFGPPVISKPSHELYGELLMSVGQPEKAIEQFDKTLLRAPKRVLSLKGKIHAYTVLGQQNNIEPIQKELDFIQKNKDQNLLSNAL